MPTLEEILENRSVEYFDCVRFDFGALPGQPFGSGSYYMTQAPYDVNIGGTNYIAAGGLLNISEITENAAFGIDKINITIAGIVPLTPSNQIQDAQPIMIQAQSLEYIDKPVTIVRQYRFDNSVVQNVVVFKGYVDVLNVTYLPESDTTQVSVDISSHWTNFNRVSTMYTNNTSQQELYPTDVGFEYSKEIQKEITWREPE